MVGLGGTFDSTGVEPSQPMEPLPTGWYAMQIVKSEIKESSKNPQNKMLKLEFEIDESRHPQLKGRKAWTNLNLWNSNAMACEIAQKDLSAICRAIEVPQVDDSDLLHNKMMAVRLVHKPATKDFGEGNDVKGYDSISKRFPAAGTAPAPSAEGAAPTTPAATAGPEQSETAAPWQQ